jgi:hypothetical protein
MFGVLAPVLFFLSNIVVLGIAAGTLRQWLTPISKPLPVSIQAKGER